MAVADANLRFVAIDVGAYGKEEDSTVFRDSPLGKKLYSDTLNLPPPRFLPDTSENPQPFIMVGDEAFKLSTNLLRPYPSQQKKFSIIDFLDADVLFSVLLEFWQTSGGFFTPLS